MRPTQREMQRHQKFVIVLPGCAFVVNRSSVISQCPSIAQRHFSFPAQTLPDAQRSCVTPSTEETAKTRLLLNISHTIKLQQGTEKTIPQCMLSITARRNLKRLFFLLPKTHSLFIYIEINFKIIPCCWNLRITWDPDAPLSNKLPICPSLLCYQRTVKRKEING